MFIIAKQQIQIHLDVIARFFALAFPDSVWSCSESVRDGLFARAYDLVKNFSKSSVLLILGVRLFKPKQLFTLIDGHEYFGSPREYTRLL